MKKDKNLLDLLSEKDSDWKKMVASFYKVNNYEKDVNYEVVKEVVQEMYLRLYKYVPNPDKIMYGDEINTMFVYVTLKNIFNNYQKNPNNALVDNSDEYNFEETILNEEIRLEDVTEYQQLQERIKEEISTWNHYDAKLFKIIYFDGVSMRQLERDTGIKLSSIFNTIKKSRLKLQTKFQSEYNIIINENN